MKHLGRTESQPLSLEEARKVIRAVEMDKTVSNAASRLTADRIVRRHSNNHDLVKFLREVEANRPPAPDANDARFAKMLTVMHHQLNWYLTNADLMSKEVAMYADIIERIDTASAIIDIKTGKSDVDGILAAASHLAKKMQSSV